MEAGGSKGELTGPAEGLWGSRFSGHKGADVQQNRTCRLLLTCKGAKEPGRRKHNLAHEKPRKDFEQSSKNEACVLKNSIWQRNPTPTLVVLIEMCCKCEIHTRFQRLSTHTQNVKYLVNLYTDYMLK